MTEEQLQTLAQTYTDEAIQQLLAEYRRVVKELEQAPTQEQMHSLVAQLKEVRGENSKLREELARLRKAVVSSQ